MQEIARLGFVLQTIRVATISHIILKIEVLRVPEPVTPCTQLPRMSWIKEPVPQNLSMVYWGLPDTRHMGRWDSGRRSHPSSRPLGYLGSPLESIVWKNWMFVHYIWHCHHHPLEGWKAIILIDSGNTHDKGQDQWVSTIGPSSF